MGIIESKFFVIVEWMLIPCHEKLFIGADPEYQNESNDLLD